MSEKLEAETVVEAFARETRHKHGMLAWPGTQALMNLVNAAEERGRRRGVEERDKLVLAVQELLHAMEYREKTDAGEYRVAENVIKSAWERAKAEGLAALRDLAPRDSGKEG